MDTHEKKIIIKHFLFLSYQSGDTATQRLCCCCCKKLQSRFLSSCQALESMLMFRSPNNLLHSESVAMLKHVEILEITPFTMHV